jgi:flagellar biogenesis protein FliO
MKLWTAVSIVVVTLSCVSIAFAAPPAPSTTPAADQKSTGSLTYTPPTLPESPAAGPLLLRLVLATTVVLSIGIGASWGIRRIAPRMNATKADSRLRRVETLPLVGGSSLHLLECCGRRFVAGVGPTGIRSLTPLPEQFENELDVLTALS